MLINLNLERAWIKQGQRGGLRERDKAAFSLQVRLSKGGRNLQHVPKQDPKTQGPFCCVANIALTKSSSLDNIL